MVHEQSITRYCRLISLGYHNTLHIIFQSHYMIEEERTANDVELPFDDIVGE